MTEQAQESLLQPHQRRLWSKGQPLADRINYACGRNVWDDWTNTDLFAAKSFPTGDFPSDLIDKIYYADLTQRHPFPDNAFRFAYCEAFLEYMSQKDSITFLFEVRRCLAPGGVLRISTVGLHGIAHRHYYDRQFENLAEEHYHCYDRWGHVHLYAHDTLRAVAFAAGFSRYKEVVFGRSEHAPLNGIDTRDQQIDFNILAELTK